MPRVDGRLQLCDNFLDGGLSKDLVISGPFFWFSKCAAAFDCFGDRLAAPAVFDVHDMNEASLPPEGATLVAAQHDLERLSEDRLVFLFFHDFAPGS
jgi:hypothetical protein